MGQNELGPQRVTQEAIRALVKRSGLSEAEAREVLEKREADRQLAAAVRKAEAEADDEAPAPTCKHGLTWCLECDATP